jgi:predicted cobalt transporter CbtA
VPVTTCRGVFTMSLAAISSTVPVLPQAEVQKPSTTPAPTQSTPAPAPAATVSISAAGHKSASAGDADHDGH